MFDGLFQNIPPITRLIMGIQLLGLGLLSLEYLTRYDLYFNLERIIYQGECCFIQVWRMVTTLFFMKKMNMFFIFEVLMIHHMLKNLQRGFSRGSIDFLYIVIIICGTLYTLATVLSINYIGILFKYIIYYIYGRTNYEQFININLIPVRAPYLIWILIFFDWMMESPEFKNYIVSILVGHTIYFLISVYPNLYFSNKKKWLDTPQFFVDLVSPFFKEEDRLQRQNDDNFL